MAESIETLGGQGYVTLFDNWGDEQKITDIAGLSVGRMPDGKPRPKLIKHLLTADPNPHMTPFENAGVTLMIKAPIFVVRQWMRHRTHAYNERSLRYCQPKDFYVPTCLDDKDRDHYIFSCAASVDFYNDLMGRGVSKEVARGVLPLSTMTVFSDTMNLRALIEFLRLRDEAHAQAEIREYAQTIRELVTPLWPTVFEVVDSF